jgi:hypothetical protein
MTNVFDTWYVNFIMLTHDLMRHVSNVAVGNLNSSDSFPSTWLVASLIFYFFFTTRKLSNTNENTNEKKLIGKLQWNLPMKYFFFMSIGTYWWKFFISVYWENYNGKWRNKKKRRKNNMSLL